MTPPAVRALALATAFLLPACSAGSGGPAPITEQGLRLLTTTPFAYAWAPVGTEVALTFNRPLDPASVSLRSLILRRRSGVEVEGRTVLDGATLRWVAAAPLDEGWYELDPRADVRGLDGSEWSTLEARRVEFAVRRDAGRWSHPVNLGVAGSTDPILVTDPLGGASLAWHVDGIVWVAEFDRDKGWQAAAAALTLPTSPEPPLLLVARGSSSVAVAAIQAQAGFAGQSVVRLQVSRFFDRDGQRIWAGRTVTFLEVLRQAPQLHVDAAGTVVMLLVSPISDRQSLRMLRFDAQGVATDERLGRAAHEVVVERVDLSALGDVAVVWKEIEAGVPQRHIQVRRQLGLDAAEPLVAIGAPRGGGFDAQGNVWTLMPATTTAMRFRTQTGQRWAQAGVELPYDVAHLPSFALDLLTLDWRSQAGAGTLASRRVDRLGQALGATDLYGPTFEALVPMALVGDADRGALALWRVDGRVTYSRLVRGAGEALAWTPARLWQFDHMPVPVERAVLTAAGRGRTYFTFVDDGRLSATYDEPGRHMPRPVRDELGWTDGDPLRRAILAGTGQGHLLVVQRTDRAFEGRWLR